MSTRIPLRDLLQQVRACRHCEKDLPLGPRPVLRAKTSAKILIIGQAPGTKVHASGIPWDDASGQRLREWMGIDSNFFYNEKHVAIIPMGFCYPGKGKSGDLPPRKECAPLWHQPLMHLLPNIELTLLIGSYAQQYYLPRKYASLTEFVRVWKSFAPKIIPLVHPSPRNRRWLSNNPWFEKEVVKFLRKRVRNVLLEI
jgi:uracil-DNA glycosylase